jgi:hypothetical protein
MEAETREMRDQDWHSVTYVRYHAGKRTRAVEIMDMFLKATEASGREAPTIIHFDTGNWDMVRINPMEEGIAQMGWQDRAREKAWWDAFVKVAGGADEADALWAEYPTLIAERGREIGHTH